MKPRIERIIRIKEIKPLRTQKTQKIITSVNSVPSVVKDKSVKICEILWLKISVYIRELKTNWCWDE